MKFVWINEEPFLDGSHHLDKRYCGIHNILRGNQPLIESNFKVSSYFGTFYSADNELEDVKRSRALSILLFMKNHYTLTGQML